MKLIVFGATGKIGREVVDQALRLHHDVTAFTRSAKKVRTRHPNLSVVEGDVLDRATVAEAIKGHDAVLCALGMPLMNKDGLRAKGTENIVDAMNDLGVKRIVCLSGLGVGDSRNTLPFRYKYLILPLLLRHVYADHAIQENHVQGSMLDWVIVRASNFLNGSHTGIYRHGFKAFDKSLKLNISHADVADFMLWQLTDDIYLRQAPGLSY